MQRKRLFKGNRKGAVAPTLTIGFLIFNIFVYIIIFSFAADAHGTDVGSVVSIDSLASGANESARSTLVTWDDLTFLQRAGWVVSYLPWWLDLFIITFQTLFIIIIVMAWVRGL